MSGSAGAQATLTLLSDDDLYLFNEGTHRGLANKLGAHRIRVPQDLGTYFAVWAPNAKSVSVIGDFNHWERGVDLLSPRASSGIWEGTVGTARHGHIYKYAITTQQGEVLEKADPYAARYEVPPRTGSQIWEIDYSWNDAEWMSERAKRIAMDAPVSVYELHLGSWIRDPGEPDRILTYFEIAPRLVDHVRKTGFTHVELLPLTEHPFYGSWGYQSTGYFAPSSRYGEPEDLMGLIDQLHQAGIGVILDWVPSHFPSDAFALAKFDGTHLYEHADPQLGVHPDWNSLVFNYGRHEVRSFLASSAQHWVSTYHIDGLRFDAVASMIYRDYSRKQGEWLPNRYGGRENLEAIDFLRGLNVGIYADNPHIHTIAEESTAWPGVSRPVQSGGLGFGYKWDMGWMHDTLEFIERDPIHRQWHFNELTFRNVYAFSENFMLPLSHDEVVHGKGSLLTKMRGDDWQQFANLRLLLGYQFTLPGKKLLFMGSEFAQRSEWNHDASLDWHLMDDPQHAGICRWITDLNGAYRAEPALHQLDCDPRGFEQTTIDPTSGIFSFMRLDDHGGRILIVFNLTPIPRFDVEIAVPVAGQWTEILNSDALVYGGSGVGNLADVRSSEPRSGSWSIVSVAAPPLGCCVFRHHS
jgi:1,4-alpha-glucan branching enzyme